MKRINKPSILKYPDNMPIAVPNDNESNIAANPTEIDVRPPVIMRAIVYGPIDPSPRDAIMTVLDFVANIDAVWLIGPKEWSYENKQHDPKYYAPATAPLWFLNSLQTSNHLLRGLVFS